MKYKKLREISFLRRWERGIGKQESEMEKTEKIEIAYAVHDHFGDYYRYLGVSMFSVMENTEAELCFHILCDATLSDGAREELKELCEGRGQEIYFYDISADERIPLKRLLRCGYTEGIFYRLYLPELLPETGRLIYLDADILVHGDICDLWETDLQGMIVAGRWDPPLFGYKPVEEDERSKLLRFWETTDWNEYINSGVLLMDLQRIRREHHLMEETLDFWDTYGFAYPDQDAINCIFHGKIALLPGRFNTFSKDYPSEQTGTFYHYTYMAGDLDRLNPIDRLYLSYWERSPFYTKNLEKTEKIQFLRRMKDHTEPYLRLGEMTELTAEEVLNLGWGYYLRGEYTKVADYLEDAVFDPGLDRNRNGADVSGQDNEAAGGSTGARNVYFFELRSAGIRAMALRKLGRTEDAAALLEKAFADDLEEKSSYIGRNIIEMAQSDLLGELYYELGRYDEAERAYLGALYFGTPSKRVQSQTVLEHLIRCTLKNGKIEAARKYFYMLQSICPDERRVKTLGFQVQVAECRAEKTV